MKNKYFSFHELSLENIGAWPFFLRLIILFIFLISFLGTGFYLNVQGKIMRLKTVQNNLEKMLLHYTDIQKRISALGLCKEEVKQLEAQFSAFAEGLPEREEETQFLEEISELAVAQGLIIESIKPKVDKKTQKEFHQQKGFEVNLLGSFKDFAHFVKKMVNLKRIVTLEDCSIQAQKKGKTDFAKKEPLRMYLQVNIHWGDWQAVKEFEEDKVDLSNEALSKKILALKGSACLINIKRDPFLPYHLAKREEDSIQAIETFEPNRKREPLESFPLDSLRMVGTFKMRDQYYGLIKDTTGLINRVTVGNYLGHHSGKIEDVNDHSIEIQEWFPDGKGNFQSEKILLSLRQAKQNE